MPDNRTVAERYAADFIKRLRLDDKAEQRCEWSCILWSKDHWAEQARKVKIDLHQAKERISASTHSEKETDTLFSKTFPIVSSWKLSENQTAPVQGDQNVK